MKKIELLILKNIKLEKRILALKERLEKQEKYKTEMEIQLDGLEKLNKEFEKVKSNSKELRRKKRIAQKHLRKEILKWKIKQLFNIRGGFDVRKNI